MELHQIRYFLALAEDLNFTRAAERCAVSQPSLTRAIKRLEEELGTPLVRRERNRTHLTEVGKRIRPRLEQALSLTNLVRSDAEDFTKMSTASLSLGVMCTIGPERLIALIDHLEHDFPQMTVTLRTSSGVEIVDWLLSGEIDVAVVGMPEYPTEISVSNLYKERYMIAFPPNHRFSNMTSVPIAELEGERYVERLNCEYMEFFNLLKPEYNKRDFKKLDDTIESMEVRHESEHEDWIQAMVVAGMGCSILPQYISLNPELQMRPLINPEIWRTISIATVRGREHTPVVSLFTKLCKEMKWGSDGV